MIGMGNNVINVVYQLFGGEEESGGFQVLYVFVLFVVEEIVKVIKLDLMVKGLFLYYLLEGVSVFYLINVLYF